MVKKKAQKQTASFKQQLPLLLLLAVIAVIGGVVLLPTVFAQRNPTVRVIAPEAYVAEFSRVGQDHFLLDVRRPDEFAGGHLEGAVNISVETLANRLNEVPRDMPIVVYCRTGNRSQTASNILAEAGFTPIYDLGGIVAWGQKGFPIVR